MVEPSGSAPKDPGLKRFKLSIQKNRLIFFVFSFVATSLFKPMGIWQVDLIKAAMVTAAGCLSAILFFLFYQRHWRKNLDPIWLVADSVLASFGVVISGGIASPLYLWYAANLGAAAFVGGMSWVVVLAVLDVCLYLGFLMVAGAIHWLDAGFFQCLTQITFLMLACAFFLKGAAALQKKRRFIRELQEDESRKVGELVRMTQALEARGLELAEANRKIVQADQAKSQFLANMSHELRTPMNSILGFSQLMESDTVEPLAPTHLENVKHVLKAGRHLLGLINEVLDLARIEAGRITLSIEPVQVGPLIREILSYIKPLADQKQIAIEDKSAPFSEHFVEADANRLRQILLNLLSNAVKYNRVHGIVTLECRETENGRFQVSVSDTGPGIPEDQQAFVFEPFHRLRADQTTVEGTGIGLTIAGKLVAMMNGSIGFRSAAGLGSCFTIELPGSPRPRVEEAGAEAPSPGPEPGPAGGEFTVLYIEDNPANLTLVKQILLRRPNIQLLSAPQGKLGLELARAHKPDLILLDIHLPDISGVEVFQHLREYEETRTTPVVAVSASAMPHEIRTVQESGITQYMTKPLNVGLFLETLDRLLGPKT